MPRARRFRLLALGAALSYFFDPENGKVVLRGEVDSPETIEDRVSKARKVQGVQDVESLLTAS